jgi:hypothetical protein
MRARALHFGSSVLVLGWATYGVQFALRKNALGATFMAIRRK